jgi:protein SCO1/2
VTRAITGVILLAGALSSAPAGRVFAGAAPSRGRTLQRHASVPAITAGRLPASDPSAIARRWGVEIASMRLASSGYMLEFRYRILDANKAQPLFDRSKRPLLRDDVTGLETGVPSPPTTGSLRSSNDAKAGRTYFMFFANPSRFVKAGNTVTVTIGEFGVSGIPVRDDSEPPAAAESSGHEAHLVQMAAAAKPSAARVMAPQPAIPDIAMVDQTGQATTLRGAIGSDKPVLVNFIFTSCTTICPVMSAGMSQLLSNLGPRRDDVHVVSISIDPEHDTVDALRAYAARYHAAPSWRFLTGSPAAVEAAQRAFASYRGGKNNHAPGTFVRPAPGSPWIALDGLASAETLARAFRGHLVPPPS